MIVGGEGFEDKDDKVQASRGLEKTAHEEACHNFRPEGSYVRSHEHSKSVIPEALTPWKCVLDAPHAPRNLSGATSWAGANICS